MTITNNTPAVLNEILGERLRQDAKWGEQNHEDGTGAGVLWAPHLMAGHRRTANELAQYLRDRCKARFAAGEGTWLDVMLEEMAEAFAEGDPVALRAELVQVAAVAAAWIEAIDRRSP